jgi:pimeloyl-ACP methyl ester carboxylesterase
MDSRYAPELANFAHSNADEQRAIANGFVATLTQDDVFVLNQLDSYNQDPKNPLYGRLDMSRVAALGHSIGGATAQEFAYRDARVRAALNLDGWTLGDVARAGLSKPWMLIYEGIYDEKLIPPLDPKSPESDKQYWLMNQEDIAAVDASLKRYGGYRVFIDGTSHWNFSDKAIYSPLRKLSTGGDIDPRLAYGIVDRYALAFFEQVFDGKQDPILGQPSGVSPAARLEVWKPQP